MAHLNEKKGKLALISGHVAGLIFLVCLPLWINALTAGYHYSPAKAGALPTLFLIGAVIASLTISSRFHKVGGRILAPVSFWCAALTFYGFTSIEIYPVQLILHFVGGLAAGTGVSVVHGMMGRTSNAHGIFAAAGLGLGIFSILMLAGVPQLTSHLGPVWFFYAFSGVMGFAALVMTFFMPEKPIEKQAQTSIKDIPSAVWYAILGLMGMGFIQNMVFSFLVEVGHARGFAASRIEVVLIVLGFVNLFPPILAAVLQHKLPPMKVAQTGSVLMGLIGAVIFIADDFWVYAIPTTFFVAVMIFCHTFIFGFMAQQDPSGRSVSATPAILMSGSALSPIFAGILVQFIGYSAISVASILIVLFSVSMFSAAEKRARTAPSEQPVMAETSPRQF